LGRTVKIVIDMEGDAVLGLAALGENEFLLLRRDKRGDVRLEQVDAFGNPEVLLTADQIR